MIVVDIAACSQPAQDLFASVKTIANGHGGEVFIEDARKEHGVFAVWADWPDNGSDIVATGEAVSEALEAALAIARKWP